MHNSHFTSLLKELSSKISHERTKQIAFWQIIPHIDLFLAICGNKINVSYVLQYIESANMFEISEHKILQKMPIEKIYYKIREHLILKLPKKTIAKKLNPVLLAFNKAVFNENKKNIAEFYPRLLIENCYGFSKEKTHLISLLSLYINEENYSILCQHLMKKIEVSIKNLIKTERLNESLVASRLNENWCGVSNEPLWEAMSYDINDMGVDKNLLEGAKNLACFSENVRNGFSENVMGGILEERYLNGKSVDENNPFR